MNLARAGRKPSSGGSLVFTLLHSSAVSVTLNIWLNLGSHTNESLPGTTLSIMTIFGGAPQKFETPAFAKATAGKVHSKFGRRMACPRTTSLLQRGLLKRKTFCASSGHMRD